MVRAPRRSKPGWLQFCLAFFAMLLLLGGYLAVMALFADISEPDGGTSADRRDLVYLYVHLGALAATAILGFSLGKWLNGLGVAYATLFLVVVAVGMVLAHAGSYALACEANDDGDGFIRHWHCGS
jgi:hypothetical protein